MQRKQDEEYAKNKAKIDAKAKEHKDFLVNEKKKMKDGYKEKIELRKDLKNTKKDLEDKTKQREKEIKENMEKYLEENKEERKSEEKEEKEIDAFEATEAAPVFQSYEKSLRQLFKFYALQDAKYLDSNLELNTETINFNEFVKFGHQQNITPGLLHNEEVVYIYRAAVRQRMNDLGISDQHVLDYKYFKKSLLRIAISSADLLDGKIVEEAKSEQPTKPSEAKPAAPAKPG